MLSNLDIHWWILTTINITLVLAKQFPLVLLHVLTFYCHLILFVFFNIYINIESLIFILFNGFLFLTIFSSFTEIISYLTTGFCEISTCPLHFLKHFLTRYLDPCCTFPALALGSNYFSQGIIFIFCVTLIFRKPNSKCAHCYRGVLVSTPSQRTWVNNVCTINRNTHILLKCILSLFLYLYMHVIFIFLILIQH